MHRFRSCWYLPIFLSGVFLILLACPILAEEEGIPIPEGVEGLMWQMGWYQMVSQPQLQIYHHPILNIVVGFHFDTRSLTKLRVVTPKDLNHPSIIEVISLGYFLLRSRVTRGQDPTVEAQADDKARFLATLVQHQLSLRPHTSFIFDQLRVQGERQPRQQMLELSLP